MKTTAIEANKSEAAAGAGQPGAQARHTIFIASSGDLDNPIPSHFHTLAHALVERGHRVVMIVYGPNRPMEDHGANPAFYHWPSPRPTRLRDYRFLRKLIREHRPSAMVSCFAPVNLMTLAGARARVPVRVAWYYTETAQIEIDDSFGWLRRSFLRTRKQLVYRMATHIVPVSEATSRDAQRVYHVPASKCQVFYNTVSDPMEREEFKSGLPRRPGQLVCAGRFNTSKGQDMLIRAVAKLSAKVPEVAVDFIGGGPSQPFCERLAEDLGVCERMRFLGVCHHDEVLRGMASAQATIVPSRADAFPIVCVESLAVSTPVVATRVGGIPEGFRDGVEGFLFETDDVDALSARLERLLREPDLRAKMGASARERFLSMFEQKRRAAVQAEWLERCLASVSPHAGHRST